MLYSIYGSIVREGLICTEAGIESQGRQSISSGPLPQSLVLKYESFVSSTTVLMCGCNRSDAEVESPEELSALQSEKVLDVYHARRRLDFCLRHQYTQ